MFYKPNEKNKKINNIRITGGNITGLQKIQISKPVKMKNYFLNPQNQIISQMANDRLENNNYKNIGNFNYQYENSRQYEKPTDSRAPLKNDRAQIYLEKYNKNHNTYEQSDFNNKRIQMNRESIDANKREPENKYIPRNQRIGNKIKSPVAIPIKQPYNNYAQNKDNIIGSKETKTKQLPQNIIEKRGYSSGNPRSKKSPQDHKVSQVRKFKVETPIKNKLQNETNSSIKKESSNKFESSSKKGKTDKNFHHIEKKKVDLNPKVTKAREKASKDSEANFLRGKQFLSAVTKPSSQQALNPNEFLNKKSNNSLEESNEVVEKEIKKSDENELNFLKKENIELKEKLKNLGDEKMNKENIIRSFGNSIKAKDKEIKELKNQLESVKNSFNEQISKLNKQLEAKIKELQEKNNEKDNEIEQLKKNIDKMKNLNKEDNEKKELIKKLQMKDKLISTKDSKMSELKSQLNEALILNEQLKSEKEKMKKNNINNEDLQITKKEKEIELKFKGLKEREKQIKNKENEINEKILFIEDTERALESQQKKLDSEKKKYDR